MAILEVLVRNPCLQYMFFNTRNKSPQMNDLKETVWHMLNF